MPRVFLPDETREHGLSIIVQMNAKLWISRLAPSHSTGESSNFKFGLESDSLKRRLIVSNTADVPKSALDINNNWIDEVLPRHRRLTGSIIAITTSLLSEKGIDFLSVSGRTKEKTSLVEKIKRKNYRNPQAQLTDITGVRIIVFVENDIPEVAKIIENAFSVDKANSSNKDAGLSHDQVGYRSVHYVCDIGADRSVLPEFNGLSGLKFEYQIRTVLQHAWAELAHDRAYKFTSGLPSDIQRDLFLHAGLLEIADKGFSDIARRIDTYNKEVQENVQSGDLSDSLNSISIVNFVSSWCSKNNFVVEKVSTDPLISDVVNELRIFGVRNLRELEEIIPPTYVEICKKLSYTPNIYGLLRDWMTINDAVKLYRVVRPDWLKSWDFDEFEEHQLYREILSPNNYETLTRLIREHVIIDGERHPDYYEPDLDEEDNDEDGDD